MIAPGDTSERVAERWHDLFDAAEKAAGMLASITAEEMPAGARNHRALLCKTYSAAVIDALHAVNEELPPEPRA